MRISCLLFFVSMSFSMVASAGPLECKIGPITKSYGGNSWLVYACSDNQSIVVVSAPGNPAMPFFFSIIPDDGTYLVRGEGDGDKAASASAHEELVELTKKEIQRLIIEAKDASRPKESESLK